MPVLFHPLSSFSHLPWLIPGQMGSNLREETQDLLTGITSLKIFQALIAIAAAYAAIQVIDRAVGWLSERVPLKYRLSIKQSLPFWRTLVFVVVLGIILSLFLNLSPNNVLAITSTIAVALGFAFKDLTSSVIAGIFALFEQPYQVGDRIRIGDHYGEVIQYGLRGLQIRTPSDDIVTIPHVTIWTDPVVNANKGALEAQVVTDFYFDHSIDIDRVNRILYRVAQTSKYTQLHMPIAVITEERPWGTHFRLKAYPMDARDEFVYKTDLTQRAKQSFRKHDIQYPRTPQAVPTEFS